MNHALLTDLSDHKEEEDRNDFAWEDRSRSSTIQKLALLMRQKTRAIILTVAAFCVLLGLASVEKGGLRQRIFSPQYDGLEQFLGPKVDLEDGFTIVVPTYKRPDGLLPFLENYATKNITSLREIIIVWNDPETQPPTEVVQALPQYNVKITLKQSKLNSLNNRFKVFDQVSTEAVLSVDDDLIINPADVEFGYQAWKRFGEGRRRMTGYVPKLVDASDNYFWNKQSSYNLILTKGAYFHRDWLAGYWSSDPVVTELRNFVHEHFNCEDILMSFLHAHFTELPPVYVKAESQDMNPANGISLEPGHINKRNACGKKFREALGTFPPLTDVMIERY